MIKFTKISDSDLEDIADWIAKDNPIRAVNFVQELRQKSFDIVHMPLRFPLINPSDNTSIRKRPYKNYLIIYDVGDDVITILRIIHAAQDYTKITFVH